MIVIWHPIAREELRNAARYYAERNIGIAKIFRSDFDTELKKTTANPEMHRKVWADVRLTRLKRFPYKLYYSIRGEYLFVWAIFHSSRDERVLFPRLTYFG